MNTEPDSTMSDEPNVELENTSETQDQIDQNTAGESAEAITLEAFTEPTIESLQCELANAEKRVLLAQADLENFRRRTRRDSEDRLKFAAMPLMAQILESLDNFERAIEAHENDPSSEGLLDGVKMVSQQLSESLSARGCKKIEAVGQTFDPNKHQALQMQPSDEFPANTVMQDLRPGFQLHDRVIRPSQVFVSTGPAKEE